MINELKVPDQKKILIKKSLVDQQYVWMEEPAELVQAITKLCRGQGTLDHLAEEMADVLIVMEQMMEVLSYAGMTPGMIQNWIDRKYERELERGGRK